MSKQMERGTENAGFLEGRDYTAAFLYEFFSLIVGNGVYLNELAPTATNEDMSVTIGPGHAWINGVLYKNKESIKIPLETADGSLSRSDGIHIRLNLSLNEAYAIGITGAYATNPTETEVVRNAEIYDLKICDVDIPAGCTKITQAQIKDRRLDSSVCGVPVFPVEHLDMTTFYRQIVDDLANFRQDSVTEIKDLLQQLNGLLDGDTVGQLIAEVNRKLSKSGDAMTGDLAMSGSRITGLGNPVEDADAVPKSYADTCAANNILNNSDFLHFIAQAGIGGAHGTQAYAGDRWILDSGTVTGAANETGGGYTGITLNGTIRQIVANPPTGDCVYGVEMVSGTADISYANGEVTITSAGGVIKNVGLYSGKILPKYVPNGYAAELQECQRYYIPEGDTSQWNVVHNTRSGYLMIVVPTEMRIKPSIIGSSKVAQIYTGSWQSFDATLMAAIKLPGCVMLQGRTSLYPGITFADGMSYLVSGLPALSADL